MIGELIGGAVPLLRAHAESMMTDTCTITRLTSRTLDPATDRLDDQRETVYSGPCRLRFEMNRVQPHTVQGQLLVTRQSMLFLPYDLSSQVRVDDQVAIAGSGIVLRIAGGFAQTYATARRFPVEALA